ncbi:MAG: hypothetical protein IKQ15_09390 [Kiritimatiellae bacterium]|nr:hypothetical protein [Kiritimatiellia bacterium]
MANLAAHRQNPSFPMIGNFFPMLGKITPFFQRLEKFFGSFPMIGNNFRAHLRQTKRQTGQRRTTLREGNGRKTHAEPLKGGGAEAGGSWAPGTGPNIEKHENRFADSERLEGGWGGTTWTTVAITGRAHPAARRKPPVFQ